MTVPTITLNNQTTIPQLGFGVFQVPPEQTADTVSKALEVGYRHIDTAQMYGNEQETGVAIADSGIARDELWITSKLNNGFHKPDDARRAFDETLAKLGLDHIDLFLIHWPLPTVEGIDFVETWKTLGEFVADGRVRSIGVSNFQPAHLDRVVAESGIVPAVNQIEVHPFFTNEDARAASIRHGIEVEAWSPIAQGNVLDDPTITEIAEAHGKSTHDRPDVTNVIRCFAIPTTSYDDLTLGVDASYYATPSGGTARTAAMALDVCGSMWARGELSQRAPYITNTLDETSSHPVPELQACVLPAGNVGVFPGATACDHLGLPVPDL